MTEFLQLCFAGLALGARYALVALGFVIIYRATGVINFAQGGLLAVGAYLTYAFANDAGLPFFLAVVLALAFSALLGAAIERTMLRPMVGQPVFAVIMITIGLLFILEQVVTTVWGYDSLNLADPWGVDTVRAGDVVMSVRDLWTLGLAAAVLAGVLRVLPAVEARRGHAGDRARSGGGARPGDLGAARCSPSRGRSRPRWRRSPA